MSLDKLIIQPSKSVTHLSCQEGREQWYSMCWPSKSDSTYAKGAVIFDERWWLINRYRRVKDAQHSTLIFPPFFIAGTDYLSLEQGRHHDTTLTTSWHDAHICNKLTLGGALWHDTADSCLTWSISSLPGQLVPLLCKSNASINHEGTALSQHSVTSHLAEASLRLTDSASWLTPQNDWSKAQ